MMGRLIKTIYMIILRKVDNRLLKNKIGLGQDLDPDLNLQKLTKPKKKVKLYFQSLKIEAKTKAKWG